MQTNTKIDSSTGPLPKFTVSLELHNSCQILQKEMKQNSEYRINVT